MFSIDSVAVFHVIVYHSVLLLLLMVVIFKFVLEEMKHSTINNTSQVHFNYLN